MTANQGHPWSDEDIAKLKSLAGRLPARDIADRMGRSLGAVVTVAARMKLSLRTRLDSNRNAFAKCSIGRRSQRFRSSGPSS
jgi:hypothetical protein